MRGLYAVNAIIASALLVTGIGLVFALGITGLIILTGGGILAAITGTLAKPTRTGVALAVCADACIGVIASQQLADAVQSSSYRWHGLAMAAVVPTLALLLVTVALVAVARDWHALHKAPWF